VNAENLKVTGSKMDQKLYRYHTGYPGGLKETLLKHAIQEDYKSPILAAVKGMLPINKNREGLLKKIIIHPGPYHNNHNFKLPQFGRAPPPDINEEVGIHDLKPEDTKIIYATDTSDIPDQFKDVPIELDEKITVPWHLREKTHTVNTKQLKYAKATQNMYKSLRRHKKRR